MNMSLRRSALRALSRYYCEGPQNTGQNIPKVPGLSSSVILPASAPVGPSVEPDKSGAYKVPEYFCYDNMSYFEAEVEMAQYRLPQPSSLK